ASLNLSGIVCSFSSRLRLMMYFFFQAEDGIRYGHVTGVQSVLFRSPPSGCPAARGSRCAPVSCAVPGAELLQHAGDFVDSGLDEIGRASCRERGLVTVGRVSRK